MHLNFPIRDVKIDLLKENQKVLEPIYNDSFYRLNQNEFSMDVEGVGSFYASGGNYIALNINPNATRENIELYLNGSTYGAILHQRKIMPLHGSCFTYENKGIMICGHSGAGKSSLTAAFVLDGNEFLTDDVTPVLFSNNQPLIWTMSDRIKLWNDSLKQLDQDKKDLNRIDPDTDKFYFPVEPFKKETYNLDIIFIIEVHQGSNVDFQEIQGADKVIALRHEIYRFEYIQGMPENEAVFFQNLAQISNQIKVVKILRPKAISIKKMKKQLENYLS